MLRTVYFYSYDQAPAALGYWLPLQYSQTGIHLPTSSHRLGLKMTNQNYKRPYNVLRHYMLVLSKDYISPEYIRQEIDVRQA